MAAFLRYWLPVSEEEELVVLFDSFSSQWARFDGDDIEDYYLPVNQLKIDIMIFYYF